MHKEMQNKTLNQKTLFVRNVQQVRWVVVKKLVLSMEQISLTLSANSVAVLHNGSVGDLLISATIVTKDSVKVITLVNIREINYPSALDQQSVHSKLHIRQMVRNFLLVVRYVAIWQKTLETSEKDNSRKTYSILKKYALKLSKNVVFQ